MLSVTGSLGGENDDDFDVDDDYVDNNSDVCVTDRSHMARCSAYRGPRLTKAGRRGSFTTRSVSTATSSRTSSRWRNPHTRW